MTYLSVVLLALSTLLYGYVLTRGLWDTFSRLLGVGFLFLDGFAVGVTFTRWF